MELRLLYLLSEKHAGMHADYMVDGPTWASTSCVEHSGTNLLTNAEKEIKQYI
jgi:hypothetical protein